MQLVASMLMGLAIGIALFVATRGRGDLAAWVAIALGVIGTVLLVGSINGWILPDIGRFGAIALGLVSGIATVLALGCIVRGERRPLNWVALLVSAPPVLFLIIFGVGELMGPPH